MSDPIEPAKPLAPKTPTKTDAFASVALWQFIAFVLLLCFVWASEVIDLPALVFGTKPAPLNIYRLGILSAAIIAAGIVTVGHTYERQRALLRKLLRTCMYCHRVETDEGEWVHAEEWFLTHYPIEMKHGACPECEDMAQAAERAEARAKNAKAQAPADPNGA